MNPRIPGQVERVQANLLQVGVVAETDYPKARARVTINGLKSAWLPWLALRAGGDRTWDAIEKGEQVLVACPDGDPAGGVILGAIYQQQYAAPADSADVSRTVYQDGAIIEYDRKAHVLKATLPDGGKAELTAPGGVTITGDTTIEGTLTVSKGVTAQDTLDVAKAVTAQSTLDVTGNTTIQGTATVAQTLNANGGLAATGAAGSAAAQLVGDLSIDGALSTTGAMAAGGDISAGGGVTSSGDQVAGGISQTGHVHTGVQIGTDETEKPKA